MGILVMFLKSNSEVFNLTMEPSKFIIRDKLVKAVILIKISIVLDDCRRKAYGILANFHTAGNIVVKHKKLDVYTEQKNRRYTNAHLRIKNKRSTGLIFWRPLNMVIFLTQTHNNIVHSIKYLNKEPNKG